MAEQIPGAEKKVVAGILAILLGGLGIHKFYLGYTTAGIIMLVVSVVAAPLTCGAGYGVMGIIGLIEGIIYLTKPDDQFVATYVNAKKEWF
jgi:TM2 domain-containing membrane protein YozV